MQLQACFMVLTWIRTNLPEKAVAQCMPPEPLASFTRNCKIAPKQCRAYLWQCAHVHAPHARSCLEQRAASSLERVEYVP